MEKSSLRPFQEQAFEMINTIDYWFRQKYNLAPTDERFLTATREQKLVEYWANILSQRYAKLVADKVENVTLDDLLVEEAFEEALREEPKPEDQEELISLDASREYKSRG